MSVQPKQSQQVPTDQRDGPDGEQIVRGPREKSPVGPPVEPTSSPSVATPPKSTPSGFTIEGNYYPASFFTAFSGGQFGTLAGAEEAATLAQAARGGGFDVFKLPQGTYDVTPDSSAYLDAQAGGKKVFFANNPQDSALFKANFQGQTFVGSQSQVQGDIAASLEKEVKPVPGGFQVSTPGNPAFTFTSQSDVEAFIGSYSKGQKVDLFGFGGFTFLSQSEAQGYEEAQLTKSLKPVSGPGAEVVGANYSLGLGGQTIYFASESEAEAYIKNMVENPSKASVFEVANPASGNQYLFGNSGLAANFEKYQKELIGEDALAPSSKGSPFLATPYQIAVGQATFEYDVVLSSAEKQARAEAAGGTRSLDMLIGYGPFTPAPTKPFQGASLENPSAYPNYPRSAYYLVPGLGSSVFYSEADIARAIQAEYPGYTVTPEYSPGFRDLPPQLSFDIAPPERYLPQLDYTNNPIENVGIGAQNLLRYFEPPLNETPAEFRQRTAFSFIPAPEGFLAGFGARAIFGRAAGGFALGAGSAAIQGGSPLQIVEGGAFGAASFEASAELFRAGGAIKSALFDVRPEVPDAYSKFTSDLVSIPETETSIPVEKTVNLQERFGIEKPPEPSYEFEYKEAYGTHTPFDFSPAPPREQAFPGRSGPSGVGGPGYAPRSAVEFELEEIGPVPPGATEALRLRELAFEGAPVPAAYESFSPVFTLQTKTPSTAQDAIISTSPLGREAVQSAYRKSTESASVVRAATSTISASRAKERSIPFEASMFSFSPATDIRASQDFVPRFDVTEVSLQRTVTVPRTETVPTEIPTPVYPNPRLEPGRPGKSFEFANKSTRPKGQGKAPKFGYRLLLHPVDTSFLSAKMRRKKK